ncbi:hypothetical protein BDC45DRAFT_307963 [Circinella umbellata]|nr:hypothetical protein BDC45DRAFT_307963 [Circinella umbellata]
MKMFGRKKEAEIEEVSTNNAPPVYGSEKVEEEFMYPTETGASFNSEKRNGVDLQEGTKRGLDARHVQMIAFGGTIG